MNIQRRHWLLAFLVAALAHGSLIVLLWEPTKSGAANLGVGGIEISFGAAGGAPGATAVPPPEVEAVDAPEAEAVEAVETPPVETAETVDVVEAVAVEDVPQPVADTVPVAEVRTKTETAKVPRKPKPPVEVKAPTPKPVPVQPPPEVAATPPAREVKTRVPSVAGSAGKSGTENTSKTGSGKSASSGGRPGSSDSYFAQLQAWLEQHKEYPSSARRRRQEGTAVLSFTMSRAGEVLAAKIQHGTGYEELDREVMEMIRRASPLPPFPDDFEENRLSLVLPVQFQLH